MSDLISRQAAIDALEQIFDRCEEIEAHLPEGDPDRTGYKMYPDYITVWKYLHQLPSAQPERQVELDGTESNIEILSELRAQFNCFDEVEEPCYRALSDAICALSAQPRMTCDGCKYANRPTGWSDVCVLCIRNFRNFTDRYER